MGSAARARVACHTLAITSEPINAATVDKVLERGGAVESITWMKREIEEAILTGKIVAGVRNAVGSFADARTLLRSGATGPQPRPGEKTRPSCEAATGRA